MFFFFFLQTASNQIVEVGRSGRSGDMRLHQVDRGRHTGGIWIPLKLSEGKDAINDEGSSIESVEIEKRLTREREDFLGGDRGIHVQLVDNRVSELC